jgi:hypothetical protein
MARRNNIASGDQPTKPTKPDRPRGENAQGYSPIRYGAKGKRFGYAKVGQARNQPGGPTNDPNGPQSPVPPAGADLSYLSDKQQAAVEKWLGDTYDPSKPLNIQLFKARWQAADQEGRRALAKRISGEYLEGGPTAKTLSGFHSEYLQSLAYENTLKATELNQRISDYSQQFGGYATSQEEADKNIAYWTEFANSAEGQAHIAGTDYGTDVQGWIAAQAANLNEGVANYNKQSDYWSRVQQTAAALGQDVPGFKPPGWESTLDAIKAGLGGVPQPGGQTYNLYPGVAADLAGIAPISSGQIALNRRNAGLMPANRDATNTGQAQPTSGASLYPVTTPALGNSHPSITGFDYNDMISEVF